MTSLRPQQRPLVDRQWQGIVLLALVVLAVLGWASHFIPHPVFVRIDVLIAFVVLAGIPLSLAVARGRRRDSERFPTIALLLRLLVGPFLAGAVAWLLVAKTLPWLVTAASGAPFREVHPAQVVRNDIYRRRCGYTLRGGIFDQLATTTVCLPGSTPPQFVGQAVSVEVSGQRSMLGTRIARVRIVGLASKAIP